MNTKYEDQMVYSGSCEDCYAVFHVAPHPESSDETVKLIEEGPDEWEAFPSCFVCDGRIEWNGNDPRWAVLKR